MYLPYTYRIDAVQGTLREIYIICMYFKNSTVIHIQQQAHILRWPLMFAIAKLLVGTFWMDRWLEKQSYGQPPDWGAGTLSVKERQSLFYYFSCASVLSKTISPTPYGPAKVVFGADNPHQRGGELLDFRLPSTVFSQCHTREKRQSMSLPVYLRGKGGGFKQLLLLRKKEKKKRRSTAGWSTTFGSRGIGVLGCLD